MNTLRLLITAGLPSQEPHTDVLVVLVTLLLGTTGAAFWGMAVYRAYRSRTISIRGGKYRRDEDPVYYWISMSTSALGLLIVVVLLVSVVVAVLCASLFD